MISIHPFTPLRLPGLPLTGQTCVYEDQFVLGDNFTGLPAPSDLTADPDVAAYFSAPYPFKIEFTMGLWCLGGQMRVRLNLTEFELGRNDLLIVLPGAVGQSLDITPDCRLAVIAFAPDFAFPEASAAGSLVVRRFLTTRALLHLADEEMAELMEIYGALRRNVQRPDAGYRHEVVMSYLQVLFFLGCRFMAPSVERTDGSPGLRRKELFDRFLALVERHYATERSVGFYAGRLCVTPKYLSQMVHAVSGRHAGEWIRDLVVLEAKALLKSQRYTVQEVSDRLHFANQSFFGVYFKRATGLSPKAYRDSL